MLILLETYLTRSTIHMQILKNIKDIKRSMIERDAAVKDVEDGASDMKRKAEDLTKKLDENEKEYQVYKGGNL